MMWGGSYYDLANDAQKLNPSQAQNGASLQFRSKSYIDDAHITGAGEDAKDPEEGEVEKVNTSSKFGTWDGVFTSCLLNIFGVIMFLRLPWVVGQAGVFCGLLVILLSGIVVVLTTMSMSAISTNGKIE